MAADTAESRRGRSYQQPCDVAGASTVGWTLSSGHMYASADILRLMSTLNLSPLSAPGNKSARDDARSCDSLLSRLGVLLSKSKCPAVRLAHISSRTFEREEWTKLKLRLKLPAAGSASRDCLSLKCPGKTKCSSWESASTSRRIRDVKA